MVRAQADAAGWKAGFYPEKGTEYKEVSGLAGGASQEEREELVVAADRCASGLTASAWETSLRPRPPGAGQRGWRVGRSVGGVGVDAARAFCRGRH